MDSVKRIRTHPTIIAYGRLYLYFSSRSYRFASKSLEPITKRTHVSIWMEMGTEIHSSTLTDRFVVVGKRKIKKIFVDETLLKINDGQDYWLWLAYDEPNLHVCLLFHISRERTIFVCYQFFRQIRTTRFGNKPIFTDGTHWYNDACR
jgi:hypothetical protein